ncbi:MAG: succinate dehydrogenase iron-sulfur subunit [Nitrososphaerota archaeon]|nr:succinate dehydrogenase iron-sulfur subunit [Nitrososphaerota archaeon]
MSNILNTLNKVSKLSREAEKEREILFRVQRFDPEKDKEPRLENYTLKVLNRMSILDILFLIQREKDPTLTFRYACRAGMCGSCAVVINGKEGLACKTKLFTIKSDKITITSLRNLPLIKDLAVDFTPFFDKLRMVEAYFLPLDRRLEHRILPPTEKRRRQILEGLDCISCAACYSACTMLSWDKNYLGPAALNRVFCLAADERDANLYKRLSLVDNEHGCWACHQLFDCTVVCPKGISPTLSIQRLKALVLTHRLPLLKRLLKKF